MAECMVTCEPTPDGNHGKLGMQLLEGSIQAIARIALPVILQGDGFMCWLLPLPILEVGQRVVIVTILQHICPTEQ